MTTFDQFTDRARQAMQVAQDEARHYNHHYLGTEHILLALTTITEGAAARALAALGVEERHVRGALNSIIGRGSTGESPAELELVPRAKRSLELALDEARQLKHDHIGTEHLLGILREGDNVAVGVLSHLGVGLPDVNEQLELIWLDTNRTTRPIRRMVEVALLRGRGRAQAATPTDTKGNVITIRVTDRDLAEIDALIEAGIRTSRSEAAAWLISAGIDAHKELFDKLHATIDQIRQLRADAQAIMQRANPDPDSPTD